MSSTRWPTQNQLSDVFVDCSLRASLFEKEGFESVGSESGGNNKNKFGKGNSDQNIMYEHYFQ